MPLSPKQMLYDNGLVAPSRVGEITVAAMASSSWVVINPVVSCDLQYLLLLLHLEPLCKTESDGTPTTFLLKIFSTAVRP